MQFTPKTEEEIIKGTLLPEGFYPFEVMDAEDKTSKSGNEMIVLKLKVFGQDGSQRHVYDYLLESMALKLIHGAQTMGLEEKYNSGQLLAIDFLGRTGTVHLIIDDKQSTYDPKNSVKDYKKDAGEVAGKQAESSQPAAQMEDDEIPF